MGTILISHSAEGLALMVNRTLPGLSCPASLTSTTDAHSPVSTIAAPRSIDRPGLVATAPNSTAPPSALLMFFDTATENWYVPSGRLSRSVLPLPVPVSVTGSETTGSVWSVGVGYGSVPAGVVLVVALGGIGV